MVDALTGGFADVTSSGFSSGQRKTQEGGKGARIMSNHANVTKTDILTNNQIMASYTRLTLS
jgi:hypothetical protein